jgi:hypothetical protein
MRVGVLTFHRCINYGSYWQARCLVEGLGQRGHDVVLLDHQSSRIDRAEWRCALSPIPEAATARAAYREKTRTFFEAFDDLQLSDPFPLHEPEQAGPYDLVVVGSDEVWNLRHPWFGGTGIFFGDGLRADRLASYAASFGNQAAAEGLDEHWSGRLRQFHAISVRDQNSQRLVASSTGIEPPLVLDPCLQFSHLLPRQAPVSDRPYALVYGHGFPEWLTLAARRWADRSGIALVSVGYHNTWADDQCIEAGPQDFARLMAGASAVITNFFHGCVFALVYGKPFVTSPSAYRFNKVHDLMAALGGKAHVVSEQTSEPDYQRLLAMPPGDQIAQRIETMRHQSGGYLDGILA